MSTRLSPGDSATATGPLLDVRDLAVHFRTSQGVVRAVDGVSFALDNGETLGIVGESGSGKSMMARGTMGIQPPAAITSGQVCFAGDDLRSRGVRDLRRIWGSQIAMIFQDPMTSLNPVVRIGRNITEMLLTHGVVEGRQEAVQRAEALLAEVRIPDPRARLRAYPHELSGGMRQRVGIALAIACRPRLLIADEPTTALDVTVQRQILDLLSEIQGENSMSMMFITHDLGVVAGRTDRVAVVYGGKIVESGPTKTLFAAARHPYTSALIESIPRLEKEPHTRIPVIPGTPTSVIDPVGCRFAPRCLNAQPKCLTDEPPLKGPDPNHDYACWFPVGTRDGEQARARNAAAGQTATGLPVLDRPAHAPDGGALEVSG